MLRAAKHCFGTTQPLDEDAELAEFVILSPLTETIVPSNQENAITRRIRFLKRDQIADYLVEWFEVVQQFGANKCCLTKSFIYWLQQPSQRRTFQRSHYGYQASTFYVKFLYKT